jgi:hypothetical protein
VQDPSKAASARKRWKRAAVERQAVFRLIPPVVIWWVWVIFAVVIAVQAVISGHDYVSAELTAGLAGVTAIVYATALRPRVVTDSGGVRVLNPFRDHRIGWGGLKAVYLGDSLEFSCARPAPGKDKTVYCWALYSGRRSRLRAERRAERDRARGIGGGVGVSSRALAEAQERARQDAVQLVADQIGRQSADAQQRGAPAAVLKSTWAWWPIAFVLVPAAVLLGLVLGR